MAKPMFPTLRRGKMNLIIDLSYGSSGKGAISRYLAEKEGVDMAVCHFSPNSAHTSVEADGTAYIVKQLPQAAVLVHLGANIELMLGADSCINPDVLDKELNQFNHASSKLNIHPLASVITPECIEREQQSLKRISSTLQGTSAAKAMKITRDPQYMPAKDHPWMKEFVNPHYDSKLKKALSDDKIVLGVFHQGYDLSINSSWYPYVTSSTVNTSSFLAGCDLPPSAIGTVIGTVRTFPIRVGHQIENGQKIGDSGPVHADMKELDWSFMTEMSGSSVPLEEKTTLTKKVRRIFTPSFTGLNKAVYANDVQFVYLNFVNYLDQGVYGKTDSDSILTDRIAAYLAVMKDGLKGTKASVRFLGTGPQNDHIADMYDWDATHTFTAGLSDYQSAFAQEYPYMKHLVGK